MQPLVSVITCAHNPRPAYLRRVLAALESQTLDRGRWEYLVVDNASDEPLAEAADLSWHPRARCVREDRLGLTHARLRGIEESRAELLVFVDDDNVLDPDYLEEALKISAGWPQVGAWSGQTRPGFDEPPPEWTRPYWGNLVIRSLEHDAWSNLPHLPETMPCGAGLCVRRAVARHYASLHSSGKRGIVLDRTGTSLLSAGDNDLAACACDVGLGVGLFTSLNLTHLIPGNRLEEDYLLRLIEGIAFSSVLFRSFRMPVEDQRRWSRSVADLLRLLLMDRRRRKFFRATRRGESQALHFLARNKRKAADA